MSRMETNGHGGPVLRNWFLGVFASAIWTVNYLVYFARDIRAWRRHRRERPPARRVAPERAIAGPLAASERRDFPPPPPPPSPVRDAEVVAIQAARRTRRPSN